MNEIVRFFECIEEITMDYPNVYFKIEKLRSNGWWRIHVFGKEMATFGDAELLFVENNDRKTAFDEAISKMAQLRTNIENLEVVRHERGNRRM